MEAEYLGTHQNGVKFSVGYVAGNSERRRIYYKRVESTLPVPNRDILNVIWIHDFYYYHKQLLPISVELVRNTPFIKSYLLDLHGFGMSGGRDSHCCDLAFYRNDLVDLIQNEIRGNCVVIGQGLGALIALESLLFSELKEIVGVVAINPLLKFQDGIITNTQKVLSGCTFEILNKIKTKGTLSMDQLELSVDGRKELENDPLCSLSLSGGTLKAIADSSNRIKEASYYFNKPIMMVTASNDQMVPCEWLRLFSKMIPRSELTLLEFKDRGHDLLLEGFQEKLLPAINRWVNQLFIKGES